VNARDRWDSVPLYYACACGAGPPRLVACLSTQAPLSHFLTLGLRSTFLCAYHWRVLQPERSVVTALSAQSDVPRNLIHRRLCMEPHLWANLCVRSWPAWNVLVSVCQGSRR